MTEIAPGAALRKDELTELARIDRRVVVRDVLLWWLQAVGLYLACVVVRQWWLVLPAVVVIGCLQNGLNLFAHEGSHTNLSRDKGKNDLWADLCVAGPLGVTVDAWRWHHLRHHQYLGDPREEIELSAYACVRGPELWRQLARHLSGWVALGVVFRRERFAHHARFPAPPPRSRAAWAGFVLMNGALFGGAWALGAWWMYFVAWVFPLFAIATLVSNFRTIVEHQPSSGVCETRDQEPVLAMTRVMEASWLERWLICPVGFYYHYEHHLYPGLPYHRLAEVRRRLVARGYYADRPIVYAKGYVRTLWALHRELAP